jgi:hypothetical protein
MNREAGGVVVDPHADPSVVAMQVVDPIGNGLALLGDQEVVHPHRLRVTLPSPFAPRVLEVPTNSFFFVSTEIAGCPRS